MRIAWHGHACFEINTMGKIIVIDPHDGTSLGIYPPKTYADIVLVTHDHFDHNAVRVVSHDNTKVYREAQDWTDVSEGIRIKSVEVPHDKSGGTRRGMVNAFLIEAENIKIGHLGDIGDIPEAINEFREVDILMIPVGGYYTIEPEEAKKIVDITTPKVVIPMHYKIMGLALNIRPVDDFLKYYPEEKIIRVGKSIEFDKNTINGIRDFEIWVFSI